MQYETEITLCLFKIFSFFFPPSKFLSYETYVEGRDREANPLKLHGRKLL